MAVTEVFLAYVSPTSKTVQQLLVSDTALLNTAASFKERRRRTYLAGRGLLKLALTEHALISPCDPLPHLDTGPSGKPFIALDNYPSQAIVKASACRQPQASPAPDIDPHSSEDSITASTPANAMDPHSSEDSITASTLATAIASYSAQAPANAMASAIAMAPSKAMGPDRAKSPAASPALAPSLTASAHSVSVAAHGAIGAADEVDDMGGYVEGVGRLHFNISHSYDLIGLAAGDLEQGIDIESVRLHRMRDSLVRRVFGDEEYASYEALESAQERAYFFTQQWTLREALIKLTGKSIFNMDKFDIDPVSRTINSELFPKGVVYCFKLPKAAGSSAFLPKSRTALSAIATAAVTAASAAPSTETTISAVTSVSAAPATETAISTATNAATLSADASAIETAASAAVTVGDCAGAQTIGMGLGLDEAMDCGLKESVDAVLSVFVHEKDVLECKRLGISPIRFKVQQELLAKLVSAKELHALGSNAADFPSSEVGGCEYGSDSHNACTGLIARHSLATTAIDDHTKAYKHAFMEDGANADPTSDTDASAENVGAISARVMDLATKGCTIQGSEGDRAACGFLSGKTELSGELRSEILCNTGFGSKDSLCKEESTASCKRSRGLCDGALVNIELKPYTAYGVNREPDL